jgi:hypothetical protein
MWCLRKTDYLKMVLIKKELKTYRHMQFTVITVVV